MPTAKEFHQQSILDHLLNADPILQVTMLILILFSVISWAIIFLKMGQLKKAKKASLKFYRSFNENPQFDAVIQNRSLRKGPLNEMFQVALDRLSSFKKQGDYTVSKRNFLRQKVFQIRQEQATKLEQFVPFLATTAATAPFIGLFGTVWGILSAFFVIGESGSSNLATVGPYIAEALVATAVGLVAAIPAVMAYNFFTGRIRQILKTCDLFGEDLLLQFDQEMQSQ